MPIRATPCASVLIRPATPPRPALRAMRRVPFVRGAPMPTPFPARSGALPVPATSTWLAPATSASRARPNTVADVGRLPVGAQGRQVDAARRPASVRRGRCAARTPCFRQPLRSATRIRVDSPRPRRRCAIARSARRRPASRARRVVLDRARAGRAGASSVQRPSTLRVRSFGRPALQRHWIVQKEPHRHGWRRLLGAMTRSACASPRRRQRLRRCRAAS